MKHILRPLLINPRPGTIILGGVFFHPILTFWRGCSVRSISAVGTGTGCAGAGWTVDDGGFDDGMFIGSADAGVGVTGTANV